MTRKQLPVRGAALPYRGTLDNRIRAAYRAEMGRDFPPDHNYARIEQVMYSPNVTRRAAILREAQA